MRVSSVDEDARLAEAAERLGPLEPADAVLVLAHAKALDVAAAWPAADEEDDDVLVIGCDSMLEIDGEILGKPHDAASAVARWHQMRGRSAVLHTGHWLIDREGGARGGTSTTGVEFADLDDDEIEAYVATGEPLRVAGAFTIDGLGGPFVERIEGDHHNVVGLSLPLLRTMLLDHGVAWGALWSPRG